MVEMEVCECFWLQADAYFEQVWVGGEQVGEIQSSAVHDPVVGVGQFLAFAVDFFCFGRVQFDLEFWIPDDQAIIAVGFGIFRDVDL